MNRTVNASEGGPIIWNGPHDAVLSAELEFDGYVTVYGYGPIHHSEVRVPVEDFQIWASTTLAEIALAERKAKP
jgi:hypothetical protein